MTMEPDAPAAIEPDTKDWTWSISSRCAECGYDGPSVDPKSVAARLRASVPRWQAVLDRPGVATRPSPEVWSPLEYACHVRDVNRLFAERVTLMLVQDEPRFANWDQDETAVAERYWEQQPADVSSAYATNAETTAALFDAIEDGDWKRPGLRSDGAHFTVATIAVYLLHDIEHHLHDVYG